MSGLTEDEKKVLNAKVTEQALKVRALKESGKGNNDLEVQREVNALLELKRQLDPNAKAGKAINQAQQQPKDGAAAAAASSAEFADKDNKQPAAASAAAAGERQTVTPWTATSVGGFDYEKLIRQFGSQPIDVDLVRRFERVTKTPAHRFLRRGLFFSQRDLSLCLDAYEKGEEIYLYTGRGPTSASMHIGHMVPFEFTKYLQDAFDAILVIQMADDEKYYFKDPVRDLEYYQELGRQNCRDIIACGFRLDKTYVFSNPDEIGGAYQRNACKMMRATTGNQIKGQFGLCTEENNIGEIVWPIYQSVPAYSTSFPHLFGTRNVRCLVPMAIDQDPYFRLARDFVETGPGRGLLKPAAIHSEFLVGLGGIDDKMSSSVPDAHLKSIFLTDSVEAVRAKILAHAFSGGGKTLKEHQEIGGRLEVDVPYQYLLYFLEDDDELRKYAVEYGSGRMKTQEIKEKMIEVLCDYLKRHQERRDKVTDEVVNQYYSRNRVFNHERKSRESDGYVEKPDSYYTNFGTAFDRYFGMAKPAASKN